VDHWPLVILKELVDNALDSAEQANVAPTVAIDVTNGAITITDNGPVIPAEAVAGILDFTVRVRLRSTETVEALEMVPITIASIYPRTFRLIDPTGGTA
jgi:DNA mismatch repair ATPase MutL